MRLSLFDLKECIVKQLLDSVFVISEIIKVSVSAISLNLRLRLITLTLTLIIPHITKTSSNNCLLYSIRIGPLIGIDTLDRVAYCNRNEQWHGEACWTRGAY